MNTGLQKTQLYIGLFWNLFIFLPETAVQFEPQFKSSMIRACTTRTVYAFRRTVRLPMCRVDPGRAMQQM